ncbi:hypothetical protein PTE30175_03041 [Pandoraea terrae]|uniref:BrnT family toxin n=1 Tax=Pandoraea terrae TaxID=1537710 RepID=A0A5E4WCI5_9BURK|nr:BrnT family toxin [Pandoraea terrae]VVE20765.1 hypothetical protein PTE30175_03041 [Pandoraea terrae]
MDFTIQFDPVKCARNVRDRNLSFEAARQFDWSTAALLEDARNEYPERRFIAVGYLNARLHVMCFTPISGGIRVISFRKANSREARDHDKPLTLDR